MGKCVPELMRVDFANASLKGAIFQDLIDAGVSDLASAP